MKYWGIWVKHHKNGVDGWMTAGDRQPALFESKKEAELFIRENTVHKEMYEVRPLKNNKSNEPVQ